MLLALMGTALLVSNPAADTESERFAPAQLIAASAPLAPREALGGGLVLFDVAVGADGSVGETRVLASAAPFTEAVRAALASWRFHAARRGQDNVATRVLVAGYFRPPELLLRGPVSVPREMPQSRVPVPTEIVPPSYPPQAQGDATVVLDVRLDEAGSVTGAYVIQSAAGFDEAAVDAARRWRFQPADAGGPASPTAVLVFAFRQPVLGPPPQQ